MSTRAVLRHGSVRALLVANVTHGSLTLNANGSFTYTPAADYNGSDSFTYQAVKRFQAQYQSEILTPLKLKNPTGYVGPSTRQQIDKMQTQSP